MKKDTRTRNWTFIIYPESCAENWREILQEQHINFAVSPLHDKDINPDGTVKKAHYHVLISFKGKKSYEQILEITKSVKATIPQVVNSVDALIRYFVHIDNPEKFQYDIKDIYCYGNIDIIMPFENSASKYQAIREMVQFIKENGIVEFNTLFEYATIHNERWFRYLCDSCAYVMTQYIKSIKLELKEKGLKNKQIEDENES